MNKVKLKQVGKSVSLGLYNWEFEIVRKHFKLSEDIDLPSDPIEGSPSQNNNDVETIVYSQTIPKLDKDAFRIWKNSVIDEIYRKEYPQTTEEMEDIGEVEYDIT